MKTNIKFSLTTFIKNVQSTVKKVVMFVLNNIEYILTGIGIAAKLYEILFADITLPPSFYTDTALDLFLLWEWAKANYKILRRRQTTCVLNFNRISDSPIFLLQA